MIKTQLRLAILIVSLIGRSAFGYGATGHQIVGAIADERLAGTPAGLKIAKLIDGFTLEKAAVIADEIKGWDKKGPDDPTIFRYTSRPRIDAQLSDFWRANPPTRDLRSPVPSHHWFHYTDVPLIRPQKYADGQAGRSRWDIVHAMRYCIAVLKGDEPEDNPRKVTKPIAIILLAHFVGDIHQPLHVGAQFFNERGEPTDPEQDKTALEDQGGNSIVLRHSATVAQKLGTETSKFHSFWDSHAVTFNLPDLPKEMPKEERRARADEAQSALVAEMVKREPANWKMQDLPLTGWPEAWANEILPVAMEAHQRLRFSGVRRQLSEHDHAFAVGNADEIAAPDGVPYADWAAGVVRQQMHKAGWRLAELLQKALE